MHTHPKCFIIYNAAPVTLLLWQVKEIWLFLNSELPTPVIGHTSAANTNKIKEDTLAYAYLTHSILSLSVF